MGTWHIQREPKVATVHPALRAKGTGCHTLLAYLFAKDTGGQPGSRASCAKALTDHVPDDVLHGARHTT